ncbi:O-antigen ligase family protein [Paenibacillus contaminans]|uniref:O-antigen ligase-related domain-containing protein n=1 Tax=Paenibacillus contaminans TaxID=450362 RepID=A0A329M9W4_9BACL|nr:O-antigen ligase family protein [Paenibacillus contaminans]RAV13807.1 hypothetical protein DQG23_32505 [Paenibacillus contaminans]
MLVHKDVTKHTINLESLSKLVLLCYICTLYAFYEIRIYVEVAYLLVFFLYLINRRNNQLTIYFVWSLLFVGVCLLSNLWTLDPTSSYKGTRAVLEVVIIGNLLVIFINSREKLHYLIKCFVIAGVVLVAKLLVTTPFDVWGTERIGSYLYNANTMGLFLSISAIAAMQMSNLKNKKVYYFLIIIFFVFIAFTGSKKAFFLFIFGLGLLYLLNKRNKSKVVFAIPISILFVIVGYQIIMSVPQFYAVLGSRIEVLFSLFTGENNIDASTRVRMELIDIGIQLFKQKPYLGYGLASFTNVSYADVYSHNNYIELLVGVGAIGTIIYYSIYIYIIFKLYKYRGETIGNIFLTIIFLLIFMEYGLVSYFGELYQMIIASSVATIKLIYEEKRKTR